MKLCFPKYGHENVHFCGCFQAHKCTHLALTIKRNRLGSVATEKIHLLACLPLKMGLKRKYADKNLYLEIPHNLPI